MPFSVKQQLVRAMTAQPLYRLVPKGAVRTFAMLRYQAAHADHDAIVEFARAAPDAVTARFSTAMIGARAALRTANDDLLERLLANIVDRYPAEPQPYTLRADIRRFQGRYDDALSDAEMARFLAPAKSKAAALVVRSTYNAGRDDADQVALDAVRRFPHTNSALWAAAKNCRTPEQYDRIITVWRAENPPDALVRAVRPLATAAARSGQVAEASQLYRQALAMIAERQESVTAVKDARLEGRGAWTAIEDLRDVLETAGVPFFFAAGTALGLVREGRPLDLDGDIDVGVFEKDWDHDRLQKLFDADARFCPDLLHPYSHKLGLKHRGGSSIDIFRFYRERDRLWHNSVFTRWFNSPFSVERRSIRNVELPLPADTDRYLTENYGDWRTPDPTFDAFSSDAPNVESTWPEYSHFHLLRRAYKQLSNGDLDGTFRELRTAGEDELAATMEAAHG
jgi:hypothetical protein